MSERVDLSALDALAEAATEGPWTEHRNAFAQLEAPNPFGGGPMAIASFGAYSSNRNEEALQRMQLANARLTRALRNAYPSLAAELRALRGALEEIDANTPTQSFVVEVRKHPEPRAGFFDAQQSLANIGDIARAALGSQP